MKCGARRWCFVFLLMGCVRTLLAQPFVHPGGLHTLADLERMRTNVLAGNHPWIDDWQRLERDPLAQTNWQADVQNKSSYQKKMGLLSEAGFRTQKVRSKCHHLH